jgi:hypothetical protein
MRLRIITLAAATIFWFGTGESGEAAPYASVQEQATDFSSCWAGAF